MNFADAEAVGVSAVGMDDGMSDCCKLQLLFLAQGVLIFCCLQVFADTGCQVVVCDEREEGLPELLQASRLLRQALVGCAAVARTITDNRAWDRRKLRWQERERLLDANCRAQLLCY